MKLKRYFPSLLLIVLCFLLLLLQFPDFFQHGNSRVIEPWGDGYKTYHALSYHINHDSTLTHFGGMNHPYGEHVVPGDCQPLLSNGIRILQKAGIDLSDYAFGILHGSLLLGFVLCALFLFLIFRRLDIPWQYAIPLSLGLTFLAPQVERMISHYGLAHPEVLPIILYLLLRWDEDEHWKWSIGIGLVVWVYSAIHFYFFAILSFTVGGFMVLRWLGKRDWVKTLKYFGNGVLMLGLPLLFYYFWMMHNDPVTDRNPVPWGFFNYQANRGTFVHLAEPHWQWFSEHISKIVPVSIEAQNYIGLVALVGLIAMIITWGRLKFRAWPIGTNRKNHAFFIRTIFITALLICLFAFGHPFNWPYGEKLLRHSGPLQQFRSIGRFAWVFYYVVNIVVFYELFHWAKHKKNLLRYLPIFAIAIISFEAWFYIKSKDLALDEIKEYKSGQEFTSIPNVNFGDFQAIVPLPYYNIGSDNFWWELKGYIGQKSQTLSIQTGLPMTSAMLTRTSLSQTIRQLQLVSEPYRIPSIFDDLPNQKPFLLVLDTLRVKEFGDRYDHFPSFCEEIYFDDPLSFHELKLSSFACRIQEKHSAISAQMDSMQLRHDNWLASDSLSRWYFDNYNSNTTAPVYLGNGGFEGTMSHWNRLVDTIWQTNYTGELKVSFWQFINADRSPGTTITWREINTETGDEVHKMETTSHRTAIVFDDNGWGLIEFTVPKILANSRIELILTNPGLQEESLFVDELLIRPVHVDLAKRINNGIWWNNRWYPDTLMSQTNAENCLE